MMRFCRETHRISPSKVAAFLNISTKEYYNLEYGESFLSRKQATQLGKLFNTKGTYFFKSALQLELLNIRTELVKVQKSKILHLEDELREKSS
jgi:hypothetical protein